VVREAQAVVAVQIILMAELVLVELVGQVEH
jgi:hypothetical protein